MKMRKMGFQPRVVRWFESYLDKRSQCTIVNGIASSPVNNDLGVMMNEELENVNEWLKLNVSKTKCLEIGTSSGDISATLLLDGEEIETVEHIKYLGVIIDRKLNFKENFEYVCRKVARKVGVLASYQRT